ncbi:MAG: hypothetical protein GEU82_08750 [Luteitalea sp.]|nr:hypothetical protein [Luteitalea sp.]
MQVRTWTIAALCAVSLTTRADPAFRPEPVAEDTANAVSASTPDISEGIVYICPMDPDVRSHAAGSCRRCGMTLVAGVPDPVEFHLDLGVIPSAPEPLRGAVLQFLVHDPWKDRPVPAFNVVHERLFHAFVVSEDLQFFEHGHPTLVADGEFQYPIQFPAPGMYRILSDFYPVGAAPQLLTATVFVPGVSPEPAHLTRDYDQKAGKNMRVSLATIPDQPTVGNRTQMRFTLDAAQGLEKYLGAWGHLLAASDDLIDMMHEHPLRADGGSQVEFELVFPRARTYRIWVQFQKDDIVNTLHFDVPVRTPQ